MIVDQSSWGQIVVTGGDRVRFLQGMVTANVETLEAGQWARASILTVKGRMVSVVDVVVREHDIVLICQPSLTETTLTTLNRYAIADDVEFAMGNQPLHRVWSDPQAVWTAPAVFEAASDAADADAVEVRRIEAGYPLFGVDVSGDNFPFETPLGRLIDYEKGCYMGQEPVSRVHSRGSGSKMLRGLAVEGEGPVEVGAAVSHADRPKAGSVTSATVSPEFGSIALAYLHRTVWEPGGSVEVDGRSATVVELPFGG